MLKNTVAWVIGIGLIVLYALSAFEIIQEQFKQVVVIITLVMLVASIYLESE